MKRYILTPYLVFSMCLLVKSPLKSEKSILTTESISFDTLFPETWYAHVLQLCMYVWDDLDTLITRDINDHNVRPLLNEAIGKMTHATFSLKKNIKETNSNVLRQDLAYLIRIIMSLQQRCNKLMQENYNDHVHVLKHSIGKFNKHVTRAIEAQ